MYELQGTSDIEIYDVSIYFEVFTKKMNKALCIASCCCAVVVIIIINFIIIIIISISISISIITDLIVKRGFLFVLNASFNSIPLR